MIRLEFILYTRCQLFLQIISAHFYKILNEIEDQKHFLQAAHLHCQLRPELCTSKNSKPWCSLISYVCHQICANNRCQVQIYKYFSHFDFQPNMVMPDMKKGLPYTFKTYKVAQSKSKQLKMPFTDPVFTHIKQKQNECLTSSYPRMWTSPSLSHPSICNWRWEMSLCFHDLYSRCHSARMICFQVPEYVSLFPDYSLGEKAEEGQFAYSKPFQVMFSILLS